MWGYTNDNTAGDFNIEDAKHAMKECEKIKSEHAMRRAELNMNLLAEQCQECNHIPFFEGDVGSTRMVICEHQLAWIKDNVPGVKREQPGIYNSFYDIELVVKGEV